MIDELQENYLNVLGIKIEIDNEYKFSGRKYSWFAVHERSGRLIKDGIVLIAINYKHLFEKMYERDVYDDSFNIEAQARITVGHEIGHGLVDYIKTCCDKKSKNIDKLKYCSEKKEETYAEQFGEYMFPDATDEYDSVIVDAYEDLIEIKKSEEQILTLFFNVSTHSS